MDTQQDKESLAYRIPAYGQHCVIPLFNWDTWDLELVPLGQGGLPATELQEAIRSRGLRMVGVLGFLDGRFCSAWESPAPPDSVVEFLARKYCEWIYRTLVTHAPTKKAADDAVDWLRALYNLPSEDRSREN